MNADYSTTILNKITSNNDVLKVMDKLLIDNYLIIVTSETKLRNLNMKSLNLNNLRTINANTEHLDVYKEVSTLIGEVVRIMKEIKQSMVRRQKLFDNSNDLGNVYRTSLILEHSKNHVQNNDDDIQVDFCNVIDYDENVNYIYENIDTTKMDVELSANMTLSNNMLDTYNKIRNKVRECFIIHNDITNRLRQTFNVNAVQLQLA